MSGHLALPPLPEPCVMQEQCTRLPDVISVTLSILEYMYMLWFNFILGLIFIFFCFNFIIIHYHTKKQKKIKIKPRIKLNHNIYASGHEKVSSGNLGSGTLADKTPAHWPRPTENWWSDPQSELLDWQNPETGPKLSADPRSTVFLKSANPLDLSPKSTIRELFKAKSADPWTYSPPSSLLPSKSCF